MTRDEEIAYHDAIYATKLTASQRMGLFMSIEIVKATEAGFNRNQLNEQLKNLGVEIPSRAKVSNP